MHVKNKFNSTKITFNLTSQLIIWINWKLSICNFRNIRFHVIIFFTKVTGNINKLMTVDAKKKKIAPKIQSKTMIALMKSSHAYNWVIWWLKREVAMQLANEFDKHRHWNCFSWFEPSNIYDLELSHAFTDKYYYISQYSS